MALGRRPWSSQRLSPRGTASALDPIGGQRPREESGYPLAALADAEQQLGQLGAEGIAGALQLAQIGGGGGERGVVEGVLDVLDRRPHLAEQPGVAVAQRVDRAPRREVGLSGRPGDQPGDVAGAQRVVAEAAGEDGAVRPGGDLAAARVREGQVAQEVAQEGEERPLLAPARPSAASQAGSRCAEKSCIIGAMTEAAAPNRIEARGLTKHFGSVHAVSDLSFSVEPGSVTGFLGPNGAGKTTTLRMILGLAKPDSGEATIGGRHYADLADPTRTVGAVLESNSFHPGRTALNHLRIYCAAAGLPDSRAKEVLAEVGLADSAGRRAGGFSLGMRQRLALATALLGNPSVLVLDEPTNGLDPEGVAWLRGFLRNIADQRQCAVLVSSHLLAEVEQTVDRIVILARGRLIRQGTLDELRSGAAGSVSVRGPDLVGLRSAITVIGPHVTVSAANGESLNVTGATAEQVGRAAWSRQLELHQLVTENVSLEEVFLELTADKAIRGSEVAGI